jgi:hypothetical protein
MVGKKSYVLGNRGFRYAKLERALGIMLDAGKAGLGSLRGRLKRLSTLGVPGGGLGKGSRRVYTWEEATLLAIALLLEDAGLDPVVVASALKHAWPHVASSAMAAVEASADNPAMLMVRVETIAGPWRTGDQLAGLPSISIAQRIDERARARNVTRYRKHFASKHFAKLDSDNPAVQGLMGAVHALIDRLTFFEADNVLLLLDRGEPGWFPIRNLTDRLRVLKEALEQKDASHGRP